MERPIRTSGECPYEKAGFFSRIFFWYAWRLIKRGAKEEVQYDAMYRTPRSEEVHYAWSKLDHAWKKELEKRAHGGSPNFRLALARAFGLFYVGVGLLVLIKDCMRLLTPILLTYLIDYFSDPPGISTRDAYLLAGGIALSVMIQGIAGCAIVFLFSRAGMEWQGGTCALIYRKALRLSNGACAVTSTGHITDLVASDAEKLWWNVWFLHGVWEGPFMLGVVLWFSYLQVGYCVFTALVVAALMLPFQAVIAKLVAHFKNKVYREMDKRVDIMGEIISGMRLIKMYCWEKPFGDIVHAIRKKEITHNWHSLIFASFLRELYTFNQRFLTASIVLVYVYMDGHLTAEKVFPMFALFYVVTSSLLDQIPWGVKVWFETGVSCKRIENFLQLEEKEQIAERYTHKENDATPAVMSTELSATWSLDAARATLSHVTFSVGQGEMLVVVGEVGAGKSSLLMSVCGELPVRAGSVYCGGSIAYCSQQPWVFSSSIRQNILFGREYNEDKFQEVIASCSLDKDLSVLPHRDLTLVGEKGVTLSGGQKARLGLARALYADADVYLLDDPLSAVDPHVGRELYDNCITGPLLKDKAVILVTHQLQYLQDAQKILVLHEGKTQAYGTYQELQASGIDFAALLPEHDDESSDESKQGAAGDDARVRKRTVSESKSIEEEIEELQKQVLRGAVEAEEREEEDRVLGSVNWRTYWAYFHAGGNVCALIFLFLMCVFTQALCNIGDWWLSEWSSNNSTTTLNATIACNVTYPWDCLDNETSSYVYMVMLGLMLLMGIVRTWTLDRITMNSSVRLHDRMYAAVVRAPIRFCDTNPKGRIINRFATDTSEVDCHLPDLHSQFIQSFSICVGCIILMVTQNPYIGLICLPFMLGIVWVLRYYLQIERQIQRILSAGHSPVLTHLSTSVEGLHTIRAFDVTERMEQDFDEHYNAMCGAWFTHMGVFGWFQYHITLATGLFCSLATFACLGVVDLKLFAMDASKIGLVLSYITTLMWSVINAVRLSSEVEICMVKAERIIRYTEIEPEAELQNEVKKPPPSWPSQGHISFDHVSFAYDTGSPLVLNTICFDVKAQEKVGIVGRTGAGKSSLIQCLFRMAEPLGEIRIDGLPINNMGLHDVRGSIAIIPQDPVLFSGTVRMNLDPFDEKTDEQLWQALKEVQLQGAITELAGGLCAPIKEGGSNLSVGQKQLFCLARAILRNNQILILDEATANADKRTDALIQATIRDKFSACTVLTIAHRLHTIMDSDRILVMEDGQMKEYDTPHVLLRDPRGLLYSMVQQTGAQEMQRLMKIAGQHTQDTAADLMAFPIN